MTIGMRSLTFKGRHRTQKSERKKDAKKKQTKKNIFVDSNFVDLPTFIIRYYKILS